MEVILLERIARLGQMGQVVRVKDGFARNFLLPRGKALRATAENRTRFETMKGELEARSSRAQRAKRVKSPTSSTAKASSLYARLRKPVSCSGRCRRAILPAFLRRQALPSPAIRSPSIRRSRRSAGTPYRSRCIRRSNPRSPSLSRATTKKPHALNAARTSRNCVRSRRRKKPQSSRRKRISIRKLPHRSRRARTPKRGNAAPAGDKN